MYLFLKSLSVNDPSPATLQHVGARIDCLTTRNDPIGWIQLFDKVTTARRLAPMMA